MREADRAVDDAKRQLSRANRDHQRQGGDGDSVTDSQIAVERALEDQQRAEHDLERANEKAGDAIPMGEVVFVPEMPATVTEVSAVVGADAIGSSITVSSGPLAVVMSVTEEQLLQIRADQHAEILTLDGERRHGTTGHVLPQAKEPEADAEPMEAGRQVLVNVSEALPSKADGQQARVEVILEATEDEVLAVPIGALSTRADGSAQIVVDAAGQPRPVAVTVGFTGDGWAEVIPVDDAKITVDDMVWIGPVPDGPSGQPT